MSVQQNPYPLRIDPELMGKIRTLAKENYRTINKEIEYRLKILIQEYEAQHGEIPITEAD